jgi:glycosyltransferase involved in cell wall biosynthesis
MTHSSLAFYCTGDLWQSGGGSTVLFNVLREYSQTRPRRATLYVSRHIKLPAEILSGFDVVRLPAPSNRALLEIFDQVIGSIILTFSSHNRIVCLNSIVPLLALKPIDLYFQMRMYCHTDLDNLAKKFKNFLGVLSLFRSRLVFVASHDHKSELCKRLGLNSLKVKVAYLGINQQEFDVAIPASYPYEYLCFVSVLRPYKNLDTLLRAYSEAAGSLNSFPKLVIVGSWPNYKGIDQYSQSIYHLVEDLGLSDHIIFVGSVNHPEAISIMKGSMGLLFPTLFEGFGLPLLEAMACKVPVITSNRNSLPEIGGEDVYYADPLSISDWARKIRVLMRHEYPPAYIASAYQRSGMFTWSKTLDEMML